MLHCFRFIWQTAERACRLAFWSAGIRIAINKAIIAMTTKSSINVNPRGLCTAFNLSFKAGFIFNLQARLITAFCNKLC